MKRSSHRSLRIAGHFESVVLIAIIAMLAAIFVPPLVHHALISKATRELDALATEGVKFGDEQRALLQTFQAANLTREHQLLSRLCTELQYLQPERRLQNQDLALAEMQRAIDQGGIDAARIKSYADALAFAREYFMLKRLLRE